MVGIDRNAIAPFAFAYNVITYGPADAFNRSAMERAADYPKFVVGSKLPDGTDVGEAPFNFCVDLAEHGLLALPNKNFVVQFGPLEKVDQITGFDAGEFVNGHYVLIVERNSSSNLAEMRLLRVAENGVTPSHAQLNYPLDMNWRTWVRLDGEPWTKLDLGKGALRESMDVEKCVAIRVLFTAIGLLNSKGIQSLQRKAPKLLNEKRRISGKPPIFGYHVLSVASEPLRQTKASANQNSHSSPRLHWRRGHIRKLPSGAFTVVKPHLVGSIERGYVAKDYRVGAHKPIERLEEA